jgi:hypothetical protein
VESYSLFNRNGKEGFAKDRKVILPSLFLAES